MIAGDSVFGQLCVNLPGASSWTEWEGQAGFEAARGAPTVVYGRRTFLARSRAQLCWARRAKCTCETTSLLPSRRKARVTNATLATDKSVSRPLCLMPGYAQWTWFFPRSAPHVVESSNTNLPEHSTPFVSSFVTLPSSWNRMRALLRLGPLLARGGSASVPKRGESEGGLPRPARGQSERGPCLHLDRVHQIHGICLEDPVSHAHQWRRAGP